MTGRERHDERREGHDGRGERGMMDGEERGACWKGREGHDGRGERGHDGRGERDMMDGERGA